MPYRQEQFANDEIYHIVVRRIEDKLLFKNIDDYYRGIFSVYELNNVNPVVIKERRKTRARLKKLARDPISGTEMIEVDKRDRFVDVLCFCLMPNHVHLLLKQLKEGGITEFMKKLGIGYGGYFNRKYSRKGYVFQNRFVSVHIKTDEQLRTVFVYIHTNPIALIEPKWKEIGIKNPERAIKFLEEKYRWSSYWDHLGKKNFPSVTEREFLLAVMDGSQGCREAVNDWIRYKGEIREFVNLALE